MELRQNTPKEKHLSVFIYSIVFFMICFFLIMTVYNLYLYINGLQYRFGLTAEDIALSDIFLMLSIGAVLTVILFFGLDGITRKAVVKNNCLLVGSLVRKKSYDLFRIKEVWKKFDVRPPGMYRGDPHAVLGNPIRRVAKRLYFGITTNDGTEIDLLSLLSSFKLDERRKKEIERFLHGIVESNPKIKKRCRVLTAEEDYEIKNNRLFILGSTTADTRWKILKDEYEILTLKI